eukprot:CAMPEP_0171944198 /NCGR_PEP_ID=MMETSP0993-20121228/40900_1 /TAXON_ID=483369 /ORGANISM="non described non described, Strain CCMP2098" /LENGTH=39 /DNA_ID= /DNA_START= /DNA_END= /DNA_ORIENTATION=
MSPPRRLSTGFRDERGGLSETAADEDASAATKHAAENFI